MRSEQEECMNYGLVLSNNPVVDRLVGEQGKKEMSIPEEIG
jgi:hypothetical protein